VNVPRNDTSAYLAKGRSAQMLLLQILIVLSAIVVLFWLVDRFIPIQGTIKPLFSAVAWNRRMRKSKLMNQ
jgi:flagellar biogenesis protein FliO